MGAVMQMKVLLVSALFTLVAARLFSGPTSVLKIGFASLCIILAIVCLDIARRRPANSHSFSSIAAQYIVFQLLPLVLSRKYSNAFNEAIENCKEAQEQTLSSILKGLELTEYGKDMDIGSMHNVEEFRKKHPLTTYAHYEKYVERVAVGEKNIFSDKKPVMLAMSSGTTGKNKVYPIYPNKLSRLVDVFLVLTRKQPLFYTSFGLQRVFQFKIFYPTKLSECGLKMGGLGAYYLRQNRMNVTPDPFVRIYKELPSFYVQAVFALSEPELGHIQGFSSDIMYSFFNFILQHQQRLADDIEQGHISAFADLPEDIRLELNEHLRPDPSRAAVVRDALQSGSVGLAKKLWPTIISIGVAKTGSFAHCAKLLLDSYFKGIPMNTFLHIATEGAFGIQLEDDPMSNVYTMVPNICFLEFIPVENMDEEVPETLLMHQLKPGQCFEIVVTNPHGLCRNRFGDVIKVVGFNESTPKYEFMYRTGQILNVAFDRTPERALMHALEHTEKSWGHGIKIQNYTATESFHMEKIKGEKYLMNRYVVFAEITKDNKTYVISDNQKEQLDVELCNCHDAYKDFRLQEGLGAVELIQVAEGAFESVRHSLYDGKPNVVFKLPRVQRRAPILQILWDHRL